MSAWASRQEPPPLLTMGRAVQVFGTGMEPKQRVLEKMLCAEAEDKPVVVLSMVGPRGTGKTTLLSAVLKAVSGAGSALDASLRFECEADQPGSAGIAVWSQLLPITLPTGQQAALLLMNTWGPFDDSCPPEQREAVLMLSALISSVLVVHVSANDACPLGDLMQLKELGVAAQGVRNCTPLQEVLYLMRQWNGTAPAGTQTDFEPLFEWAQGRTTAKQAVIAIQEASDWYGSVSLFLDVNQAAGVGNASPDPTTLLASQRAVKRFDKEAVPAAELASYFDHLADVLARGPCDAATLVRTLVEANQRLAMHKAELVYDDKMKMMEEQWQTAVVSEQDLRAAHDRAAHQAQLTFMMARKMDGEDMKSENMKNKLLDSLDKKHKRRMEALTSEAKELEKDAEVHNAGLVRTCKEEYEKKMELALEESHLVTLSDLMKSHERYRQEALSTFDNGKKAYGHYGDQQRMELYDGLEQLFRTYANKLNQRKEKEEEAKAMETRIPGILKKAERHYQTIMEAVKPTELSRVHEYVQNGALLLFESDAKDMHEKIKEKAREKLLWDTENQLKRLKEATESSYSGPASTSGYQPASAYPSEANHYGQNAAMHDSYNAGFGEQGMRHVRYSGHASTGGYQQASARPSEVNFYGQAAAMRDPNNARFDEQGMRHYVDPQPNANRGVISRGLNYFGFRRN